MKVSPSCHKKENKDKEKLIVAQFQNGIPFYRKISNEIDPKNYEISSLSTSYRKFCSLSEPSCFDNKNMVHQIKRDLI